MFKIAKQLKGCAGGRVLDTHPAAGLVLVVHDLLVPKQVLSPLFSCGR